MEWISLADYYQFPHVVQFDSLEDCLINIKIASTDLNEVSMKMEQHNVIRKYDLSGKWSQILQGIETNRRNKGVIKHCYIHQLFCHSILICINLLLIKMTQERGCLKT